MARGFRAPSLDILLIAVYMNDGCGFQKQNLARAEQISVVVWASRASSFYMGAGCVLGVDWMSLRALRQWRKRGQIQLAGALDMVAQGALWPNSRRKEAGYPNEGVCPHCGMEEALLHLMWTGVRHKNSDVKAGRCTQGLITEAVESTCTSYWLRGLLPRALTTGKVDAFLLERGALASRRSSVFPEEGRRSLMKGTVAGTDGSGGDFSSDPRLRRYGAALVLGRSAARPWPFAVIAGEVWVAQTGNSAELTAIWWLDKFTNVLAAVDSSYVINEVLRGASFSHSSNHDLWSLFWAATRARRGDIAARKVKSHCNPQDVLEGKIGFRDFVLNGMVADWVAGLAAAGAALPQWLRLEIRGKNHQVFLIRCRLAAIAQAKATARQGQHANGTRPKAARLAGLGVRRRLTNLGAGAGHQVHIGKIMVRCLAGKTRSRLRAAAAWERQACVLLHKAIAEGAHSSRRLRRHRGFSTARLAGPWRRAAWSSWRSSASCRHPPSRQEQPSSEPWLQAACRRASLPGDAGLACGHARWKSHRVIAGLGGRCLSGGTRSRCSLWSGWPVFSPLVAVGLGLTSSLATVLSLRRWQKLPVWG
jgi:hypothetical protein